LAANGPSLAQIWMTMENLFHEKGALTPDQIQRREHLPAPGEDEQHRDGRARWDAAGEGAEVRGARRKAGARAEGCGDWGAWSGAKRGLGGQGRLGTRGVDFFYFADLASVKCTK
jgi:hypothetical protein